MHLINGYAGITGTWLQAASYIQGLPERECYNLVLNVSNPCERLPRESEILRSFNALLLERGEYPINTVADTIFPQRIYREHSLRKLPDVYRDAVFPVLRKKSANRIDTYANRVFWGLDHQGRTISPLIRLIDALQAEMKGNNVKRHRYEMSLSIPGEIPISRNTNTAMGFPCMSHLSFHLDKEKKALICTAIYRSHDYHAKALGNMFGVYRLQKAICEEVKLSPGALVVHSTHAFLGRSIKDFLTGAL